MKSSAIMSIGTALRRAADHRSEATVIVGGYRLCGLVEGIDEHGVLLYDDVDDTVRVVRVDSIDAVEIKRAAADPEEPDAIPLQAVGS